MKSLIHRMARRVARLTEPSASHAIASMGRGTYGRPKVLSWADGTTLRIGSYCSISANVTIILGGEHRTDWVTTYPFSVLRESARHHKGHPKSKGDVVVEHDVWIGYGSVILSGVTLHTGCVVGCNAVVTRSVPPYTIVAGNPAVEIRRRFNDETVRRLLATQWWSRSEEEIDRLMPFLLSQDVESFLRAAEA